MPLTSVEIIRANSLTEMSMWLEGDGALKGVRLCVCVERKGGGLRLLNVLVTVSIFLTNYTLSTTHHPANGSQKMCVWVCVSGGYVCVPGCLPVCE